MSLSRDGWACAVGVVHHVARRASSVCAASPTETVRLPGDPTVLSMRRELRATDVLLGPAASVSSASHDI